MAVEGCIEVDALAPPVQATSDALLAQEAFVSRPFTLNHSTS
jgi:hypothetical protein